MGFWEGFIIGMVAGGVFVGVGVLLCEMAFDD
jgi:hypothetical protein